MFGDGVFWDGERGHDRLLALVSMAKRIVARRAHTAEATFVATIVAAAML
jgi:hypothetical protein